MFRAILLSLLFSSVSVFAGNQYVQQDTLNRVDEKGQKQGRWVRIENGHKRYEGQFQNDKPMGRFTYYHTNGKVKAITLYSNQGKMARTKIFDIDGELEAAGNYIDKSKDSTWTFYFKGGKVISSIEEWKNGKKNGLVKTFYLDGKPASECNYVNNEPEGNCKEYFTTGTLKKEYAFKNGLLDGAFKTYHMNQLPDLIGKYEKALKVGDWIEYNDNGKIRTRKTYRGGILAAEARVNGVFKETYPDAIPMSEIEYKEGKKEGAFKEYHDVGTWKKVQKQTEDGEPEFVEVLEGTKLKREGTYMNDKLQGKVTTYDVNGKVVLVENYKDGVAEKK